MSAQRERRGFQPTPMPVFSQELAETISTHALGKPRSFILERALHMAQDNPDALGYLLTRSYEIITIHPVPAGLSLLRGGISIYAFFDQHAIDTKTNVRIIPKQIVDDLEKRETVEKAAFDNASEQKKRKMMQDKKNRAKQLFGRQARQNPNLHQADGYIYDMLKINGASAIDLLELSVGSTSMYELFEKAYQTEPAQAEPPQEPLVLGNKIPQVPAEIGRMALVHILLGPKIFTADVFREMESISPALASFTKEMSQKHPEIQELQELFAAFTFYCLNEAYKLSQRGFPAVSSDSIARYQKRVARALVGGKTREEVGAGLMDRMQYLMENNTHFNENLGLLMHGFIKDEGIAKYGPVVGGLSSVVAPLDAYLSSMN